MVSDVGSNNTKTKIASTAASTSTTQSTSSQSKTTSLTNSKEQIGKNEFLQLLITQLKNQDPMDPMKPDEFAVHLAQFTQVEQLMQINEKLAGTSDKQDFSSLAAYLGHDVTYDSDQVHVEGGSAGFLKLDLDRAADQVDVKVLGAGKQVLETLHLGAMGSGKHTVDLSKLKSPNGDYKFEVSAQSSTGEFSPKAKVGGVVTGFIPGADPMLLVGGTEISPSKVVEVSEHSDTQSGK